MGQKVNPLSLRLGFVENWRSNWFASKRFGPFILEDHKIRTYLKKRFSDSGITRIDIGRTSDLVSVNILASRPGLIIGRKGAEINAVSAELRQICGKPVNIDVKEIPNQWLDATFVAENLATQLSRRGASFRFPCKRMVETVMQQGAGGVKVEVSGRLAGAEISRSETFKEGKMPLHTLTALVDFSQAVAYTPYGTIGVKVWIYKGDAKEKA